MKITIKPTIKKLKAILLIGMAFFISGSSVSAETVDTGYDINLGNANPLDIAVSIINWGLGILALIAVGIMIYGGFVWMFSRGEEDKIAKGKKVLINGLIGLVIILAAWGIATYLIRTLSDMTGQGSGGSGVSSYVGGSGSPFMIDHTNPADLETDVTLCHLISVTFTLPIQQPTVNEGSFTVTLADADKEDGEQCSASTECKSSKCDGVCIGSQLAGTFAFSEEPSYVAVWYPNEDYLPQETYRVRLTSDIVGIDEVLIDTYNLDPTDPKRIFTFTTGTETDEIPPKVDVLSITPYPNDDAEEVCRNTPIQATFSESLDPASVKDANVWLYHGIDNPEPWNDVEAAKASDELSSIRFTSIGGEADDTFITSPAETLTENTPYGLNLYSGEYLPDAEGVRDNFTDAIRDTCGNPLSGDFDDDMEGHRIDDFTEESDAAAAFEHCLCIDNQYGSCNVNINETTCDIDGNVCTLSETCTANNDNYIGFTHPWTFTTGTEVNCVPDINDISDGVFYYSEDQIIQGQTDNQDTDLITVTGEYLYPFYDVNFYYNVSAAGMNCFDANHDANMSCFVGNIGNEAIQVRLPSGVQSQGRVHVENEFGSDSSSELLDVGSPYIRSLSPYEGPPGQFVTVRGGNFIDYDPDDPNSEKGRVYFNGIEVETPCADGWDDNQIIIKIPEDFINQFNYDDYLLVQVVTVGPNGIWEDGQWDIGDGSGYDDKYSNKRGFTLIDGDPGPGLCALEPACSDTGEDNVAVIGQNFSGSGNVYFDTLNQLPVSADVLEWGATYLVDRLGDYPGDYDYYADYEMVLTDQVPITEHAGYEVYAEDADDNVSNALAFDLPCTEPPSLYESTTCDLVNTFYLPNPRPYEDEACINSNIRLAFTDDMDDLGLMSGIPLEQAIKVYNCGDGALPYDANNCSQTEISGTWSNLGFLNMAYFGGDPVAPGIDDPHHELFELQPTGNLSSNTWYKVYITQSFTNNYGVVLDQAYEWQFKVREGQDACSIDVIDLRPSYHKETSYDPNDIYPANYNYNNTDYTYLGSPYNTECFALRGDFDWRWTIDNVTNNNIIKFDDGTEEQTISGHGYNKVGLQGEGADNYGVAYVSAGPDVDHNVNDNGMFEVDFGFCTSDEDCQYDECTESTCNLETFHCTPEINNYTPDTDDTDLGPGGCITINGCYFGASRLGYGMCECTDPGDVNNTCDVRERYNNCLLDTGDYCYLDPNDETAYCGDANNTPYAYSGDGSVTFNKLNSQYTSAADYLSEDLCQEDPWHDSNVVVELKDTIDTGADYSITLQSDFGVDYTDTFGEADDCNNDEDEQGNPQNLDEGACEQQELDWEEPMSVSADATPCLCSVVPGGASETEAVSLYGKFFDTLGANKKAQFADYQDGNYTDPATDVWNDLGDDEWSLDTTVPPGSVSNETYGVKVTDGSKESNSIPFSVECNFNSDCTNTRCCSEGQCMDEWYCNVCAETKDCSYGQCASPCINGVCQPYVIAVSPGSGNIGQPVTVQGCHFGSYYNPINYPNVYSKATFNGHEAELACDETDSWNNEEIKVFAPELTFDPDEQAEVKVTQVYRDANFNLTSQESISGADYCTDPTCTTETTCVNDCQSEWHTSTFERSTVCTMGGIPVLCRVYPANGNNIYQDRTTLEGDNYYGNNYGDQDQFCRCDGPNSDYCDINVGDPGNCNINYNFTCYADPDAEDPTSVECNQDLLTTNEGYNYFLEEGCSIPIFTNQQDCIDNNATWDTMQNLFGNPYQCRCVNREDITKFCYINPGDPSCLVTDTYNCTLDENDPTLTCDDTAPGYLEVGGNVEFAINQDSTDWTWGQGNYYPEAIDTIVPADAETGNIYVQAITESSTCESNGSRFDIVCATCDECSDGMMCDYTQGVDPNLGVCTSSPVGYCAADTRSCCGNTGCRETATSECTLESVCQLGAGSCVCTDAETGETCTVEEEEISCALETDGGFCYDRPLVLEQEIATARFDPNGNFLYPSTEICPNAEITIEFDTGMTTSDAAGNDTNPEYDDYIKLISRTDYQNYINNHYIDQTDFLNLTSLAAVEKISETEYLLQQNDLLGASEIYYIVAFSEADGVDNSGLIDTESFMALGCSDEQKSYNPTICAEPEQGNVWAVSFRTRAGDGCPPDYVDAEATDTEFIDAAYTFISEAETQDLRATVYFNGDDGIRGSFDDQAITGIDGVYNWDYTWETKYESLDAMAGSACPIAGVITEGALGTCSCNLGDCEYTQEESTCTINENDVSCTTDTQEDCYFDISQTLPCDQAGGCECTLASESCTMAYGDQTCDLTTRTPYGNTYLTADNGTCDNNDLNYQENNNSEDTCSIEINSQTCDTEDARTCDLGEACTAEHVNYSEGGFEENQRSQTYTAGSEEGETWGTVVIQGDGTIDHNWLGSKQDAQFLRVIFCDSIDYLYSYLDEPPANTVSPQNFSFAYCRGSEADNLLPELDTTPTIKRGVHTDDDYIVGYIFKNDANEDLFGIRVYKNNLDGDDSTLYDVVKPDTWADLNLENFVTSYEETFDGYESVANEYNTIVAATNLTQGTIWPNMYMISINKDAEAETLQVLDKVKSSWFFNTNGLFAPDAQDESCTAKKDKLIRDMQRITDLGETNYILASSRYPEEGGDVYPTLSEGSYIVGMSNSVWPSWLASLGNDLGQSLATDPYNAFNDTVANCPYNEGNNQYFDESGTCWDPINKDYYCPEGSYVYQYVYNEANQAYSLYANLEFDDVNDSIDWDNDATHNPCYGNGEYSPDGCACFDYKTDSSTFADFYYGTCDNGSCINSGYLNNSACTTDDDCQIVD